MSTRRHIHVGDQAVAATEEVVAETPMYDINNEDELQEFLIMEVRSHKAIWNQQSRLYQVPLETKMAWRDISNNFTVGK